MPRGPRNSPRAPHTDPDRILSHHPARAIARRLPPSAERRPANQLTQISGDDPPPSLQPHYRTFTTTRQSAPLRRIGTFGLAVGAACAFPLASPARFSRSVPEPDRASRCLHAGCRSVGSRRAMRLTCASHRASGRRLTPFRQAVFDLGSFQGFHAVDGRQQSCSIAPSCAMALLARPIAPHNPRQSRRLDCGIAPLDLPTARCCSWKGQVRPVSGEPIARGG